MRPSLPAMFHALFQPYPDTLAPELVPTAAQMRSEGVRDLESWFAGGADDALREKIDGLVSARVAARAAKDWAAADRIRDELAALKVEVMDSKDGATWRFRD